MLQRGAHSISCKLRCFDIEPAYCYDGDSMSDEKYSIYSQSGVIPVRTGKTGLEVLLITSRRRQRWIIPKGVIEPDMSPEESAVKEALEEAGVCGKVASGEIGRYTCEKWGGTCTIRVFALRVKKQLDSWPEASFRRRRWVGIKIALRMVENTALAQIIKKIPEHLGKKG